MKTCNTFIRNLRLSTVLFLCAAGALLVAPQEAFAQATVSSIAFTSDPGSDKTYILGEKVQATVTFSQAVHVTGTPQLELKFDHTTAKASYKRRRYRFRECVNPLRPVDSADTSPRRTGISRRLGA